METGVPLHPAIVHLPLGLAMIMPFLTFGIFILIKKEVLNPTAWILPVVLQVVVVIFTFTSMQLGERDEEMVEEIVAEEYIEAHEDAGKIFLILGIVSLAAAGLGLKKNDFQGIVQLASVAVLFVSLGSGMYAGKLGGELVYVHGAASAFSNPDGSPVLQKDAENEAHDDDDDDDD